VSNDINENLREQYGENKKITDGNYDKSLAVKCVNGTFVGKKTDNVIAYKGIPFVGKQPVGALRWKAPVDCVPDSGVYEAYYYGKAPCQASDIAAEYGTGEDCLYLNIWKADDGIKNKSVIVWIYGGAFESGGTINPMFDCHNLVKENPDVIFVTIAYRVGFFGFLHLSHLPDGKDYTDAQNLGLLDQLAALKWVHDNIENFGGDSENVTIWGQSAGGASVTLLPLIKGSHKYFKRVIAESGAPNQTRSAKDAISCTNEFIEILGCKTVADLQKVDIQKLFDASAVLFMRQFPERDGNCLPLDPYDAYANGAAKDIDFLQGCNKDEINFFVQNFGVEIFNKWADERKTKLFARLTDAEKALVESFCNDIGGESCEKNSRLFEQIIFMAPMFRMSENQAKAGGKSYTYLFTPESALPAMKSCHAMELSTVFNHPELADLAGRELDETFSKTMRKMFFQFAKTGNPSLSADISPDGKAKEWPLYDTEKRKIMVLDEFNIHPENESALKIVDWDRTYFLTNYYAI